MPSLCQARKFKFFHTQSERTIAPSTLEPLSSSVLSATRFVTRETYATAYPKYENQCGLIFWQQNLRYS
ncbi:hypothetical protein [Aphanothece hegewaldii]|uniref:hypothetical protein n=1 Tax=Aphanothece hegewaldii TaxID=1521625 RepID=UPI001FE2AC9B|nr:hypothetical protein [Aphanothece hegewaldii]